MAAVSGPPVAASGGLRLAGRQAPFRGGPRGRHHGRLLQPRLLLPDAVASRNLPAASSPPSPSSSTRSPSIAAAARRVPGVGSTRPYSTTASPSTRSRPSASPSARSPASRIAPVLRPFRANQINVDDLRPHLIGCTSSRNCHLIAFYHGKPSKQMRSYLIPYFYCPN
ncbi:hypothetical protein PAHAL_7G144900 [Panicum hallii]|jgi:hypothetical protein|uniref:Uncharacterized protein n=1 Tax=Panicum hallii TaxID=206008 RepID=A0A2S3I7B7_9POAL|nr:hypothetical protein PAHAL_7G144900 [Panicum hallii]